jgi:Tfp pilus assembly protein PilV
MKKNRGQTIVEIVVALGVLVLVVLALVSVTTVSARNAQFARNQALATQYAQEGIERIRNCRDTWGWDFLQHFWFFCWIERLPSPFTYDVDCTFPDADTAEIVVTVSWTDSKGVHNSQLTTRLTNWRSGL